MLKRDKNKNKFVAADLIFIFFSSSRLLLPKTKRPPHRHFAGVTASVKTVSLRSVRRYN
jgi:hypothetical protein